MRSPPRTSRASPIAISSRPTSWSATTAGSRCSTSASPRRWSRTGVGARSRRPRRPPGWPHRRDPGLHVARTGARRAGRHALGHLLARHRVLRDVDGPTAVRRRQPGLGPLVDPPRHAASGHRTATGGAARAGAARGSLPRQEPVDRFQSALDLRHSLEEVKQDVDSGDAFAVPGPVPGARQPTTMRYAALMVAAALVAVVGIWLGVGRDEPSAADRSAVRNPVQVTSALDVESYPTWSPDGQRLAYQANEVGLRCSSATTTSGWLSSEAASR